MKTRLPLPHALFLLMVIALPAQRLSAQTTSDSDSTEDRFGVGFDTRGMHVLFALLPVVHVGARLNIESSPGACYRCDNRGDFDLGLYTRVFFLAGPVSPYLGAEIATVVPPKPVRPDSYDFIDEYDAKDHDRRHIYLVLGGQYFLNQHVGIYGEVKVVERTSGSVPTRFNIGMHGGTVGVEFYF